jgi:hypothetical protein
VEPAAVLRAKENSMPDIHGITFDEIGKLGVDETGRLYWDGKPVVTRQEVRLQWWVNLAVIAAGVGTVSIAISSWLAFIY